MVTYPNQKVITVNKNECKSDFLQVNNESWHVACDTLSFSAFKLWLYMISNKDGYTFALSYEAINEAIPMSRNTYDNAIKDLRTAGYLTHVEGNQWNFNEII